MILIVRVTDGRFLECWNAGGEYMVVEPPIYPHFWSYYKREGSIPMHKRLLSTMEYTTLYRVDVENTMDVRRLRDGESLEANIPFVQNLIMLYGFTHKDDELKHAAWDMENITSGQFPPIGKAPITEIAWYSESRKEVLQGDETAILEGFVDICKTEDVDVYDTYNGEYYDWRVLVARAELLGVKLPVGRRESRPWIRAYEKRYGRFPGMEYDVRFAGRLSYDIYKRDTKWDTALTGKVNDRQLKTVANFMFPEGDFIKVDRARLGKYTAKERWDYCLSDARATYMLAEHYLGIHKMLAHYLNAPMNMMIERSPSHVGNYVYGKEFKKLDVVSDGANHERFEGILWE